jgi:serine/threonine-protein kinase
MSDVLDRLTTSLSDRYAIERQLGVGGMAAVYLARDLKHDRNVALKVVHPELAAAIGTERFLNEIRVTANLHHPHIVQLYDSGEADGLLYYVMPVVEGESLRDKLNREGQLSIDESVAIACAVAEALDYAHRRDVIHRDIKPENILLQEGTPLLADFGIAIAVSRAAGERITETGLSLGTPSYMSPEQATGARDVDARSDIYALGSVLYEMLAGDPPFLGSNVQAVIAKVVGERPVKLRTIRDTVPGHIEAAVDRALAKVPADRFGTAKDFAWALTDTTSALPQSARRKPVLGRALVGVAAALVIAAAGWFASSLTGGPGVERLAVLPLTNLAGDSEQDYLVAGVHEALISELARLGISVIARTSMAQYRNTDRSIPDIASELKVDAVIEGSVFRDGDSLEINVRMIDPDTEEDMWRQLYGGKLDNVVVLYRDLTRDVADEIRVNLDPQMEARLSRAPQVTPESYEAYLRGMHHLNKSTPEDFEKAVEYFHEAVDKNPGDPMAYAGLALGYVTLGHGPAPPPDVWPLARAAADRAVRLDSTLAEGWAAIADIKLYVDWDWEGAERAFQRANELNPSLAMNHYHHAWYLVLMGRLDEAVREHERARELDPLTPLHTVWLPALYYYAGQHEKALAGAREVLTRYPDHATALYVFGTSAAQMGLYDEAIAALEKAAALNPRWRFAVGRTFAQAGRRDDALRILAELESEGPSPWGAIAMADLNAALGDYDAAFEWLAYDPPHAWLPWSRENPVLEPVRDDPRFDDLLRRLNLPR